MVEELEFINENLEQSVASQVVCVIYRSLESTDIPVLKSYQTVM